MTGPWKPLENRRYAVPFVVRSRLKTKVEWRYKIFDSERHWQYALRWEGVGGFDVFADGVEAEILELDK